MVDYKAAVSCLAYYTPVSYLPLSPTYPTFLSPERGRGFYINVVLQYIQRRLDRVSGPCVQGPNLTYALKVQPNLETVNNNWRLANGLNTA